MTQIEVGGEKCDIGGIACFVEDDLLVAMVAKAPIARWVRTIHEIIGRGIFSDHISCMIESGRAMKFVFVNSDLSHEVVSSLVKCLISKSASVQYERELIKARRSHPSSGSLIDYGANRYHNDKPKWVNNPPSVRKR